MQNFKVLLVDDEEDFVTSLSERIGMREVGSDVALNGEQALEKLEEEAPDVMVLDLKMPGMDGLEVLKKVKDAYPQIQVIILTGHGSEKHEEEARRLGAYEYLQKPVGLDTLMGTMRAAYQFKMEQSAMAATFAEAGDYETARQIMGDKKKKK